MELGNALDNLKRIDLTQLEVHLVLQQLECVEHRLKEPNSVSHHDITVFSQLEWPEDLDKLQEQV